ncbi:MAG: transcription termination factor Rho [Planctomycetes bacterium]|nr:transcription termination factor Rho [Planctomycetota bacterium]
MSDLPSLPTTSEPEAEAEVRPGGDPANESPASAPSSGRRRRSRRRRRGAAGQAEPAPTAEAVPASEADEEGGRLAPVDSGGEASADAAPPAQDGAGSATAAAAAHGEALLAVPPGKRVVIGITGEPGSGKSALARAFAQLGARRVDVDGLGHEVLELPAIKQQLVERFGSEILRADGSVHRRALAARAFADSESTQALNAIVHPELASRARAAIAAAGDFVAVDCALLHELGLHELCTATVYVYAAREQRLARVQTRGWDEEELARREAALGSAEERRRRCQFAVNNHGNEEQLHIIAKVILAKQLGIDPATLRRASAPSEGEVSERAGRADEDRTARAASEPRPASDGGLRPAPSRPPLVERPPVRIDLDDYLKRSLPDLQAEAEKLEVRDVRWLRKHDLIVEILRRVAGGRQDEIVVQGYMELHKDQHGYIRSPLNQYHAVNTDAFVSGQQLRRYGLKPGMLVKGVARAPRGNEKCPQLLAIHEVMGEPEQRRTPCHEFEHLTPLHAYERLFMELPNDPTDYSLRIMDLVCPIGKGQRGLIVAQPKCGKTVYLQKIAKAITTNNPEVTLIVLLVDERPEEVTDMERSVKGEVIASTFDQPASRHVQVAEITINKAKRLVELGKDVVILLDSITRLARAYNTESPGSGRVMSGGIESGALVKPKQFFGAARKIEGGGSLTILATALVDTGSLADTVIFEEFKGTGNMELVLDRRLADRRIFPAINIAASGTRKDELLVTNKDEHARMWALRRFLAERSPQDAVEFLKNKLRNYKTNVEFLLSIDPEKISAW